MNEETKRFFTMRQFAEKNKKQGSWPDSEPSIWAIRNRAPENGFGEAFVIVGGRVLVDEEKFLEVVSSSKRVTEEEA